jgi:hypothetical protein
MDSEKASSVQIPDRSSNLTRFNPDENKNETDDGPENMGRHLPVDNTVSLILRAGAIDVANIPRDICTDCCVSAVDGLYWAAYSRRYYLLSLPKKEIRTPGSVG